MFWGVVPVYVLLRKNFRNGVSAPSVTKIPLAIINSIAVYKWFFSYSRVGKLETEEINIIEIEVMKMRVGAP
jgi:hypothetical protein